MSRIRREPATRVPTQERAQETFEVILDGAAKLLSGPEPDNLSTTRIAETAGVNIATLYQYFKDREAVISALASRESRRPMEVLVATLSVLEAVPLAEAIPLLVKAVVEAHFQNPRLRTRLRHALLPDECLAAEQTERHVVALLTTYLRGRSGELGRSDVAVAALLTFNLLMRISEETMAEGTELTGDRLSLELSALLLSYLVREPLR